MLQSCQPWGPCPTTEMRGLLVGQLPEPPNRGRGWDAAPGDRGSVSLGHEVAASPGPRGRSRGSSRPGRAGLGSAGHPLRTPSNGAAGLGRTPESRTAPRPAPAGAARARSPGGLCSVVKAAALRQRCTPKPGLNHPRSICAGLVRVLQVWVQRHGHVCQHGSGVGRAASNRLSSHLVRFKGGSLYAGSLWFVFIQMIMQVIDFAPRGRQEACRY